MKNAPLHGFRHGKETDAGRCGDLGNGMTNGRLVHAYAQDFKVLGGTFSEENTKKICKVLDKAMQLGTSFVGL